MENKKTASAVARYNRQLHMNMHTYFHVCVCVCVCMEGIDQVSGTDKMVPKRAAEVAKQQVQAAAAPSPGS